MEEMLISIVIPVYNGSRFLKETYQRINQSEKSNLEIIFVDDGSKDDSQRIIEELKEKDDRIRYYKKENGGIASARNFGLQHASGEYICFLDQDDYVKQDMFSLMLSDIQASGADFVQAGTNCIINGVEEAACEEEGTKLIEKGTEEYQHYLKTLVMRGVSEYPECTVSGSIWSCLFRTDFLRKNQISFYSFCDYEDDWIFCILAFKAASRICLEKKTVYSWRVHNQSESHNRVVKDRYLVNFYENHWKLRSFLWNALEETEISLQEKERFECELQKQALLWDLSNETGRGILNRTVKESAKCIKEDIQKERREGICRYINRYPLSITGYEMSGLKLHYHRFRDYFLTFLLVHHMEGLAVILNKKILHGRWHI